VLSARQSGLELLRALCVLALLFLNFAHTPVSAGPLSGPLVTTTADASFCGDPLDGPGDHAPCHACRIGGAADLPPPVPTPCPPHALVMAGYAIDPVLGDLHTPWRPGSPRAPPASI
jgi:hypothetical protein